MGGECEPAVHAKAVNHCMQLWQGNDDEDETDLEACVQDVCFGDEGIADAMMETDKISKEEKAKLKAEKEAAKQKKADEKAKKANSTLRYCVVMPTRYKHEREFHPFYCPIPKDSECTCSNSKSPDHNSAPC